MSAFDKYIGIAYVDHGREMCGCDCWGLLRLVHADMRGVELPSFDGEYTGAADKKALLALVNARKSDWIRVEEGQEQPLDGVLMRGDPYHIGVVVRPGRVLHIENGSCSVIADYRASPLKHRVLGFYRHRGT